MVKLDQTIEVRNAETAGSVDPGPVLGAAVLEGDTAANREAGQVRISNIRIVEGRFPAISWPHAYTDGAGTWCNERAAWV